MAKRKISLKNKLLALVVVPVVVCTSIAVIIASLRIQEQGEIAIQDKSKAILSRMEAVRSYVANQNMVDETAKQMLEKYPDGNIPLTDKQKILHQVPIIASWMVGEKNAAQDNYTFKIASSNARNPKYKATRQEEIFLNQMKNTDKETFTYIDDVRNEFWVMRPVYLQKKQGCLKCHGNPQNSPYQNGKDILGYPMENWKDGDLRGMFMIISDLKPLQAKMNSTILNISLWGLLIAIIAISLGIWVVNQIIKALKQIHTVSRQVADGDLTRQVDIRTNDELGELGKYINSMIQSLKKVLMDIKNSAMQLANATREISSSSNQISENAQNQASQFEQLSGSVQSTADNSATVNKITKKSVNDADVAGSGMENAVNAMAEIANSSKEIEEAIRIISDIAFQTNLLALNAAVEAARAGQQGKGFAVVASEVKKLAERSSYSAKQITQIIEKSRNQVETGVQISKDAGEKIQHIINGFNQTARSLQSISDAAQEQAHSMEQSTSIITANAAAAQQLAASADALASQANYLNEIVAKFKVDEHTG